FRPTTNSCKIFASTRQTNRVRTLVERVESKMYLHRRTAFGFPRSRLKRRLEDKEYSQAPDIAGRSVDLAAALLRSGTPRSRLLRPESSNCAAGKIGEPV